MSALQAVEIGSIEQVVVGVAQDAAEWFLEWVEVHNARSNEVKRFYCKQWLSATRAADKHKIRTLSLQQDPEVEYHVVVKTADLRGAGTDAGETCTLESLASYCCVVQSDVYLCSRISFKLLLRGAIGSVLCT